MKSPKEYLDSVGIETFVKYFEVFEANKNFRSNLEIKEAFIQNEESWSVSSINTKAHVGKVIFQKGYVLEVLQHIVNSQNVDESIKLKANKYLQNYDKRNPEVSDFENNEVLESFSSPKISIVARELLLWAFNQEEVTSNLKLEKVETRNPSVNEVVSYKCTTLGTGTFLKVFREKPLENELKSGNIIRFFDEPLSLDFIPEVEEAYYCYMTNQWTLEGDFYSLKRLIEEINNAFGPSKTISLHKGDIYRIDVIDNDPLLKLNDKDLTIETQSDDLSTKSLDPNIYKINDGVPVKKKKFNYKDLKSRFISRLKTQNRKYASGIYFFPVLFNRFKELGFNSYIEDQINKVTIYSKDEEKFLNDYERFVIENGTLYGICESVDLHDSKKEELYFNLPEGQESLSFKDFVRDQSDLSLGHIDSMYKILHELHKEGKLKQIDILSKEMQRLKGDYKRASDLDPIQAFAEKNVNMKDLKKELDLIHERTAISLIPKRINSAIGK